MRITKAMLRAAKRELRLQLFRLIGMTDDQLLERHRKEFPHRDDLQRPALGIGLAKEMTDLVLDQSIPDRWCD